LQRTATVAGDVYGVYNHNWGCLESLRLLAE
jgi:hypothetical protein